MELPINRSVKDMEQAKFRQATDKLVKVAVTVEQDEPIPFVSDEGEPLFLSGQEPTDPNNEIEIIQHTVSAGLLLKVNRVIASCFVEGAMYLYADNVLKGSARTAPGKSEAVFEFNPAYRASSGEELSVKFKARPNSAVTEVECYLQGSQIPI
jgi:hypothetical protein